MSEDPVIYQTTQTRLEQRNSIKTNALRMIYVTFQREGIHRFPAAATDPNLADVAFLANDHRHIFHFKVAIQVLHNDREIEFIQFKRWLEGLYKGTLSLNHKSCEMISDELYDIIATRYPDREIEITVSEDDENGSIVRYNTTRPNLSIKY